MASVLYPNLPRILQTRTCLTDSERFQSRRLHRTSC